MKETDRQRIIDRKAKQARDLRARVSARKLKQSTNSTNPEAVSEKIVSKFTSVFEGAAEDIVAPEPRETLKEAVQNYVDEYTAAQAEINVQRNRLIKLRGGEDSLTEEDLEALENIRDLVAKRYEKYLEI